MLREVIVRNEMTKQSHGIDGLSGARVLRFAPNDRLSGFLCEACNSDFMRKIVFVIVAVLILCPGSPFPVHGEAPNPRGASLQSTPDIASVKITIQDAPGLEDELGALARDLIDLEPGRPFSDVSLMQAIDVLKISRRFASIDVQSSEDDHGITLFFMLKPYKLIEDIKIFGEFPLFEKDILRVMTLYTGGVFIEDSVPSQVQRIEDLYRSEGFIDPKTRIEAHQEQDENRVVLHVNIEKGQYYSIDDILIEGNQGISDFRLKSKMRVWVSSLLPGSSGRFREEDLKKDVKNLTTYYYKRGFPQCRIEYTTQRHPDEKRLDIVLKVSEGPEYIVDFSGNEEFWGYTLKKDLVIFQQGNASERGLRKSIKNIKQRYIDAGYAGVDIDIQDETVQTGMKTRRTIDMVIHEGPRTTIDSLTFEGDHALEDKELKEQIYLEEGMFFTRQVLEDDLLALRSFYLTNGFGDAVVDYGESWSPDRRHVSVVFKISQGVQTIVSSIRITGLGSSVSEQEAYGAVKLRDGTPLRRYMLRSDENALSALISEKGYPHVKVQAQTSFSDDKSRADIVYSVDEGPFVTMGGTYYQGNLRTREKVLKREIEMDMGEPFSLRKMLAGQKNIRDMAIFNSVQFNTVGLKEKRSEITLLADVEEKKPYYFQIGGGYESERGFFAQTRGGDHNIFGSNKDAWVAGEVSQIGYRAETGLREPRLFATRTSASLGLFTEKRQEFNQNFGTRLSGASLVLSREMTRSITGALGFRYEYREEFLQDSISEPTDTFDEDVFDPRSVLVTTPAIIFDTRDSFIKPTKGIYSSLSVDVSKGIRNSLDNFLKYRLEARYYVTPLERITLAWLGRVGYLDPFGPSDQVPDDQLFYLGGTLDVRGFDENLLRFDANGDPLGGRFALAGSVEARIDLWRSLEFTCFYDIGTVRDTYEDIGSDDFRSSIGLGLRYLTPIGPIGVLYGHKLDRKHGESPGRFHFSVGYTF